MSLCRLASHISSLVAPLQLSGLPLCAERPPVRAWAPAQRASVAVDAPDLAPAHATPVDPFNPPKVDGAVPQIIMFGPPASGKGTHAGLLVRKLGVIHISTGDIFRHHIKRGTPLGQKVKAIVERGELVPDDLVVDLVVDRVTQEDARTHGWLLDGFPRTRAQAERFRELGHSPTVLVHLDVPDWLCIERMAGRLTDPLTGATYHKITRPPPADPEVRARLVVREDDTLEAIVQRLKLFHTTSEEVLDVFKDVTFRVDGRQPTPLVTRLIEAACRVE